MADTTQYAALMLDANGNVDRVRTTDGQIYYIASTIAMDAANKAHAAAFACNSATDRANAAEEKRVSAENTRASNEQSRLSAEVNRANNEVARVQNEKQRRTDEATRTSNENARKSSEQTRERNEEARKAAETRRNDEHAADQQASANAAAAANGAAVHAEAIANQVLQIANSVVQGSAGDSDISDLRDQNAALATMLADATGKFIFIGGTVYAPSSKASYSNGTVMLGSTCSVSGTTLVLA